MVPTRSRAVGDDVVAHAAVDAPTVTTAGSCVMSTCRQTMVCSAEHDLRSPTTIGSTPRPRHRTVGLPPCDDDREAVGRCHHRPGPIGERAASRCPTMTCSPKIASTFGLSSTPSFDHQRGAAVLSRRRPFLGRLEDEHARCPAARSRIPASTSADAQEHRHVRVVPAGVHHADLLAVAGRRRPCDANGRSTSSVHRQRVHVRAQRHDRPGLARPR